MDFKSPSRKKISFEMFFKILFFCIQKYFIEEFIEDFFVHKNWIMNIGVLKKNPRGFTASTAKDYAYPYIFLSLHRQHRQGPCLSMFFFWFCTASTAKVPAYPCFLITFLSLRISWCFSLETTYFFYKKLMLIHWKSYKSLLMRISWYAIGDQMNFF